MPTKRQPCSGCAKRREALKRAAQNAKRVVRKVVKGA